MNDSVPFKFKAFHWYDIHLWDGKPIPSTSTSLIGIAASIRVYLKNNLVLS